MPRQRYILGIDPGLTGALVLLNGGTQCQTWPMPVQKLSGTKEIDFEGLHCVLYSLKATHSDLEIICEQALPMAMGAGSAFHYGRGYAAVQIAIELLKIPVTYVHPKDWTRIMHEGISSDIKPKAKSMIAVKRNYPQFIRYIPKNRKGVMKDGPVDALLIALYGFQNSHMRGTSRVSVADFFK